MVAPKKSRRAALVVLLMLIFQLVMLGISFGSRPEISIFCTGFGHGWIQWAFAILHISFLGLLALGVMSLRWHRAMPFYLGALVVGLAALPLQAKLVHTKVLQCDVP